MDDFDNRARRSALKLVAVGVAIGFLLGLAVGATLVWYNIDRTIVIPMGQGIKT